MKIKKLRYPGTEEAEQTNVVSREEEPDFIGLAPNYDKFEGWDADNVLAWLNID